MNRRTHLPEYNVWAGMKARCNNPANMRYRHYGERGIRVCDEWNESFDKFYADMGPRPTPKHSIDRINNNGNYEPGNCRWATDMEQRLNRSDTARLTVDGITKPIGEWAELRGIKPKTIKHRLSRGWSPEEAVRRPALKFGDWGSHAKITADDVRAIRASTERSSVLAARYGVSRNTIRQIICRSTWKDVA